MIRRLTYSLFGLVVAVALCLPASPARAQDPTASDARAICPTIVTFQPSVAVNAIEGGVQITFTTAEDVDGLRQGVIELARQAVTPRAQALEWAGLYSCAGVPHALAAVDEVEGGARLTLTAEDRQRAEFLAVWAADIQDFASLEHCPCPVPAAGGEGVVEPQPDDGAELCGLLEAYVPAVSLAEVEGGVQLVFTTSTDVRGLRAHIAHLARLARRGLVSETRPVGPHSCAGVPAARARVAPVEGGATLTLTTPDLDEVEMLVFWASDVQRYALELDCPCSEDAHGGASP